LFHIWGGKDSAQKVQRRGQIWRRNQNQGVCVMHITWGKNRGEPRELTIGQEKVSRLDESGPGNLETALPTKGWGTDEGGRMKQGLVSTKAAPKKRCWEKRTKSTIKGRGGPLKLQTRNNFHRGKKRALSGGKKGALISLLLERKQGICGQWGKEGLGPAGSAR